MKRVSTRCPPGQAAVLVCGLGTTGHMEVVLQLALTHGVVLELPRTHPRGWDTFLGETF